MATVKLAQHSAAVKNNRCPRQLPVSKLVRPLPTKITMPMGIIAKPIFRAPLIRS
jgi:hypothetical protein